jgi:hypothetical protein
VSEVPPSPFTHLLPEAALATGLSLEDRITYIGTDRWLPYQRATEILNTLEDLLKKPRVNRPPSLQILARSGNGKSHILEHFSGLHPGIPNLEGPNILAPVILIETPPTARAKDLYTTILYMLNRPTPRGATEDERRDAAVDILRTVETKVLMFDEINHLLSGSPSRQREFMFALKYLSNLLQMSIVIAGTPESRQLTRLSDQLENRFKLEGLPIWNELDDLRMLLANFEQALPLRQPSLLSKKSVAQLILTFGVETIGDVSSLLNASAIHALKLGEELITQDTIKACAPLTRAKIKDMHRRL